MKPLGKTLRASLLVCTLTFGMWSAKATVLENDFIPLDLIIAPDCDGDFVPEDVIEVQGDLHVLITETVDKAGGVHQTWSFQPVNVSGVGLSGDTYRAVGITRQTQNFKGDQGNVTFVNNFYIIGQGSGIKYLVHEVFHVTIVNGEVVVSFDHSDVKCP